MPFSGRHTDMSATTSILRTAVVACFVGFIVAAVLDAFGIDGDAGVVAAVIATCVLDRQAQAKGQPG